MPEEIGIGYVELLSQSLAGLLVLIVHSFLFLFLLYFLFWFLIIIPTRAIIGAIAAFMKKLKVARQAGMGLKFTLSYLLCLPLLIGGIVVASNEMWPTWLKVGGFIMSIIGFWLLLDVINSPTESQTESKELMGPERRSIVARLYGLSRAVRKYTLTEILSVILSVWSEIWRGFGGPPVSRRLTLGLLIVAFLLAAVVFLPLTAIYNASAVLRGERILFSRKDGFGLSFAPGWGGQTAIASWTSGTPPQVLMATADHCLMFLGQAKGITILYDVTLKQTIRVSSGSVAVSTVTSKEDDPSACDGKGRKARMKLSPARGASLVH